MSTDMCLDYYIKYLVKETVLRVFLLEPGVPNELENECMKSELHLCAELETRRNDYSQAPE